MTALTAYHRRLVLNGPVTPGGWLLQLVLLPFGYLFGFLSWLRWCGYRYGFAKRYRAKVPVISVGNLAVGGTGKTPVVDSLTHGLLSAGYRVAIVSRGYGGKRKQPVAVVSRGAGPLVPARECGDEPYLLARRNPAALVAVGPRRRDVVQQVERLGADVVLLDDGYQHHAVHRDLDLVLLDTRSPLGNRKPLPAGLLREFPAALQRADALIFTRCDGDSLPDAIDGKLTYGCRYRFSATLRTLTGEERPFADLLNTRGVASAGIADPERFFQQLRDCNVHLVDTIALPDHVAYSEPQREQLVAAANAADFIVTTEKDAVKMQGLSFSVPCYQVALELEFLEESSPLDLVLRLLKEYNHDPE